MTTCLRTLFSRLMKNREMLSYLVYGVLTTLVIWAVYFALTSLLGLEGYPPDSASRVLILNGSQIASWVVSVLFAFVTNKRYVFQSREKRGSAVREFLLFLSARGLSYLLFDLLAFNFTVFGLGVDHGLTKLLMNVLVVLFNYFASKYVIFARAKQK